jgi:hypothetical protein
MLYMIANINEGSNKVLFYNKQGQGKGVNALYSLRMKNYLKIFETYQNKGSKTPFILINI